MHLLRSRFEDASSRARTGLEQIERMLLGNEIDLGLAAVGIGGRSG